MCDCVRGSILVSTATPAEDPLAREILFETFPDQVTMLQDAVTESGGRLLGRASYEFAQVEVAPGDEQAAIDRYTTRYLMQMRSQMGADEAIRRFTDPYVGPVLQRESLASGSVSAPATGGSAAFSFSTEHGRFTQSLGTRPGHSPATHVPSVAILDSGWTDPGTGASAPTAEADLTQGVPLPSAPDGYGHGTVVSAIVQDLVPSAEISVFKIFESRAAREWTFMAGLASAAAIGPDVVNAAVGFGLHDRDCTTCGRDYGTTRSLVFKRLLDVVLSANPTTVFVAAAGNNAASAPTFPARYGNAVCVTSWDGTSDISTFANIGALDEDGNQHAGFVCAPGGDRLDKGRGRDLYVADFKGSRWRGTSFATAYVAAVLAGRVSRHGPANHWSTIPALAGAADGSPITGYSRRDHGAGAVQWF